MPRTHPIFPSFTTGEVSPLMYGRVDFAKYSSACRIMLNALPRPHGPATRRPGTHFVAEVKDSTKFTRLLPFEFSTTQAYIIEAGNLYFRFYKDGGRIESPPGTPVEVVTPYTAADLPMLKYVQSADVLYLVHPLYAPRKLTRESHTSWTLTAINFLPPPTYEAGRHIVTSPTLTLSATSGLGITVTASSAIFLAGHVGRMVTVAAPSKVGRLILRSLTDSTHMTADVVETFATTGAFTDWTIQGSPNAKLTPSANAPTHAITTLTLDASGWEGDEVGKFVRVNGGVVQITKYTSDTVVEGEILSELRNVTAAPGGSWSKEESSWSSVRGYPRAVTLHDQRAVYGGTAAEPQTFWGSQPGQYEVFALGPEDDDAYEFVLAARKVNTILWLLPTTNLLLGTASNETVVSPGPGATNASVGPNNVWVKPSTFWGSSLTVSPVQVGLAALFVSRTGTKVREMVYSVERDAHVANDMLLLAEHMTKAAPGAAPLFITDMAYQQHPDSTVWCVRSDGVLLTLTYQREHDVVGWARQVTGPDVPAVTPVKGKYEAVAVVPHWQGDRDVPWVIVNRTINGASKRFVEYFDAINGFYGNLGMDCALTYSGVPATTLTGLAHLNGETVTILGDGAVYPDAVVSGGAVTLNGLAVTRAEIGLKFDTVIQPMRPEVPNQGTSQGVMKQWSEIWVRLDQSLGVVVNGDERPFRDALMPMDSPPALFTGDVQCPSTGLDRDGLVTVEQRQPLPLTVVAIFGTLGIGE